MRLHELEILLEVADVLTGVLDLEGRFQDVGAGWDRVLGHPRDQLLRRSLGELVHADGGAALQADLARLAAAPGEIVRFENRFRHRDGSWRDLSFRAKVTDGLVYAAARDVTSQRQVEGAYRESQEIRRAIIDSTIDHLFLVDRDGKIQFINRTVPDLDVEQVLGTPVYSYIPEDQHAKTRDCFARVAASGQPDTYETLYLDREGHPSWFDSRVGPVFRDGEIVGFMINSRDVSDQRAAAAEREELIRELEDKNRELELYTQTVSHDLKSPLVTIRSFLHLVRMDAAAGDLERLGRDVDRIDAAARQMSRLIDELLELSRAGRVVDEPDRVPMKELAHETLVVIDRQVNGRRVEVEVAGEMPVAWGDRGRLQQVLQNLISNALKFLGDQAHPRVEIGVRRESDEDVYYVRDNGIGLDDRYRERIFGLFDKLDPELPGTGFGLALVRRIVEVHGGRVWAESPGRGKGSTFCFTLPGLPTDPT